MTPASARGTFELLAVAVPSRAAHQSGTIAPRVRRQRKHDGFEAACTAASDLYAVVAL